MQLYEVSTPITHIVRFTSDGKVLSDLSLEAITSRGAVHRAEFHQGLVQAVGKERISLQSRCTQMLQHEDGIGVQFADGHKVQADLLVGADGIHSGIATQLFGQCPLRYAGYTTIRAITSFTHPFLPLGKLFQTWGRGGLFGAIRLTQGRVYWYLQLTSSAASPRREKAE